MPRVNGCGDFSCIDCYDDEIPEESNVDFLEIDIGQSTVETNQSTMDFIIAMERIVTDRQREQDERERAAREPRCLSCDRGQWEMCCRIPVTRLSIYDSRRYICCRCLRTGRYERCEICEGAYDSTVYSSCPQACGSRSEYENSERPRGLLSYSYKPPPEFRGTGPLYLGPEIEVTVPARRMTKALKVVYDATGDLAYVKEDGSVDGFEIVTHPMSYDWAMNEFPWKMLDDLAELGCRISDYDNGIHVHVSRAGFTGPSHVFRWMQFFYRSQSQVERLARRRGNQWATFSDGQRDQLKHTAQYGRHQWAGRYSAINTTNRDTYEIRVFKSSLDTQEVQAAFGLSDATVRYAGEIRAHDVLHNGAWTWPAFTQWVTVRPEYAPLVKEMEKLQCVS